MTKYAKYKNCTGFINSYDSRTHNEVDVF